MFILVACSSSPTRMAIPTEAHPSVTSIDSSPTPFSPIETATTIPPTSTSTKEPVPSATPTVAPSPSAPAETPPAASTFPSTQDFTWKPVINGLDSPLGIVNAGDGSNRLFILEQAGVIRIFQDGTLLPNPFLDIRGRINSGGERGLLGLAFDPQYRQNGSFYVNYTDLQGNTMIARFQVTAGDPNRADPNSETPLLQVNQPFANHNGGMLAFGLDGFLYLGLGDGGSQGDPHGNGQSVNTLLGKILRINVDQGQPYSIPADNPFANGGGRPEIWAYGLRNPWRFSFDRLTGELWIGDVGQDQWEEIDTLPAGSPGGTNFGWNYLEGTHPYQGTPPAGLQLTGPVAEYSHAYGCAVTGGYVYRGRALPAWQGIYLYGDYCSGNLWGLLRDAQGAWESKLLYENVGRISSFGEDEQGELYLADLAGTIYQLSAK